MTVDRDVEAFSRRAADYDAGAIGRWHQELARRCVDLAARVVPSPRHVLDLGSGTGYGLSLLARTYPAALIVTGLEPAAGMLAVARGRQQDARVRLVGGKAERLPFVTVSSTWSLPRRPSAIGEINRPGLPNAGGCCPLTVFSC